MIKPRIMKIHFQGNPQTTIITCYSPTNVSEETEVDTFNNQQTDTIREIPKQTTNRNGQMLNDSLIENNMICLNTKFQKREGQFIHLSPNNLKSQIDYLMINKNGK